MRRYNKVLTVHYTVTVSSPISYNPLGLDTDIWHLGERLNKGLMANSTVVERLNKGLMANSTVVEWLNKVLMVNSTVVEWLNKVLMANSTVSVSSPTMSSFQLETRRAI
eukprot:9370658-Pyramimonas_sp.AAC.2